MEDVAYGLERAPRTLKRLFTGENFGKQLPQDRQSSADMSRQAPEVDRSRAGWPFGWMDVVCCPERVSS